MYGYNKIIARINLSSGKVSTETLSEDFCRNYLGGRGIIVHTLLREMPPNADPLGPENRLVFALGPMTGHPFVGSGRHSIGCKSPLTGGYGESEAGGYWGVELKRAGFDALIVEGASEKPVYLWVHNGDIEIRDAGTLWGLEVADTHNQILAELKDKKVRTALIGPAGEKRISFACVLHDLHHAAGRTGIGAVMGSKNLKAVAVRGERPPEAADRRRLIEINKAMLKNYKKRSPHWIVGTGRDIANYVKSGNLPIRNFQGGPFPGVEKITPQVMCEKYLVKMEGCFGCPIRCKRVVKLESPYSVDPGYGGPEYETLGAFGSNCGIDNLEAIMKANDLCNRYGLDTISTGGAISFAMECFENKLLTLEDTDGVNLSFGNADAMLDLVEKIARREGLGELLSLGSKQAAEKIGPEAIDFAMQVKGEDIPMHEPRYKQIMGVHYSIHATGADHGTGVHDVVCIDADSGRNLFEKSASAHLTNTLGVCKFVPWTTEETLSALEAIIGWRLSAASLQAVAERGVTLMRIFNLREGFTAENDKLPPRFAFTPPDSPLQGIDPVQFKKAQKDYYRLMGWDENGVPTMQTLRRLDIKWAAAFLNRD